MMYVLLELGSNYKKLLLLMVNHHRKLENMYLSAPINELYKPTIKITEGECFIESQVSADFFHAANALHGSVYFKVLDDAAFFAANSVICDVFVLTGTFEIKLIRPVNRGNLIAKGELLKHLGNKLEARAKLFNENGIFLAMGSGLFIKSDKTLVDIESYKI